MHPRETMKYTQSEWLLDKHSRFNQSENARLQSERLVAESNRLIDDTVRVTQEVLDDVNKRLEQRIQDVDYWRSEVNRRQIELRKELDILESYKGRFDRSLEQFRHCLDIARQCLTIRQQRTGIDLVHDIVQENLLKEVDILIAALAMQTRGDEQRREQIRLLRKAKFHLESDIYDKMMALKLDNFSVNLRPYSAELKGEDGVTMEPYAMPSHKMPVEYDKMKDFMNPLEQPRCEQVSMQEWKDLTNANIKRAEAEFNNSVQLRGILDGLLGNTMADIRYQVNSTDRAFDVRIKEIRATKSKLEEEHAELDRQISSMEVTITDLRSTLVDMEKPLTLTHTRLNVRANRPNIEFCRDAAHMRLEAELEQINHGRNNVLEKLKEAQRSLNHLQRNAIEVEEDIKIKSQSLYIDEVQCGTLRRSIVLEPY